MELDKDCFLYIEHFLDDVESLELYEYLAKNITWEKREITVFGKKHFQPRLIAWFGEKDYNYSHSLLEKKEMPDKIKKIKSKLKMKMAPTHIKPLKEI